jgi:hypothetical protein
LEYADRTLEDYFHNEPPATDENIRNFWERLFGFVPLIQLWRKLQMTHLDDEGQVLPT